MPGICKKTNKQQKNTVLENKSDKNQLRNNCLSQETYVQLKI